MEKREKVKKLLLSQLDIYPEMQITDVFKTLYQSELGCEHYISDEVEALKLIRQENAELRGKFSRNEMLEPVGEYFYRLHLANLKQSNLSEQTLSRLFVMSAYSTQGTMEGLSGKLNIFEELCISGELPFEPTDVRSMQSAYRAKGCPPIHHSEIFRNTYNPAYRVLKKELCHWLSLFCQIDRLMKQKARVLVAIDGNSAAGKTTLALLLKEVYNCNVFSMDDFFLRPWQRTAERLQQPGGNVDYERFRSEVIDPLLAGLPFSYRPYDCKIQSLKKPVSVLPHQLNIIDGVYSLHPKLADAYDLSVFLELGAEEQYNRILLRNGPELYKRYVHEWIPMEQLYFEKMNIKQQCDINSAQSTLEFSGADCQKDVVSTLKILR